MDHECWIKVDQSVGPTNGSLGVRILAGTDLSRKNSW